MRWLRGIVGDVAMMDPLSLSIVIGAAAAVSSVASTLFTFVQRWRENRQSETKVTIKLPDGRTIDLSQTLPPERVNEIVSEVSRSAR
jgi:hypothetical protein